MLRSRSREQRMRRQYEEAVRAHSAELYAFAFRLSGFRDVAEDLVQETFYHAWKGLDSLRKPKAIRPWLFQILRHRHAHWRRSQTSEQTARMEHQSRASSGDAHSDPAIRLSERESIQQALNELDERSRLPILMVCIEGLTCRETAEQLDLPLGTVLSRIHRARKALEAALSEEQHAARKRHGGNQDHPSLRLGGDA